MLLKHKYRSQSLYFFLQILSVSIFEKSQILGLINDVENRSEDNDFHNQSDLFDL